MAGRISKKVLKKESTPKSKGRAQKRVSRSGQPSSHADMLALQRNVGNRGVGQLLQSETDGKSHTVDNVPPIVESVLNSDRSQALDAATRESMESRFGQDLGQVRIHTGAKAAESAKTVNALAYTAGQDVVFGPGRFVPQANDGRQLLAHELAHIIQQRDAGLTSSSADKDSPTIMRAAKPGEPETPSLFGSTIKIPAPTITRVGGGILATVYFGQDNSLLDSANFTAVDKLSEELRFMYKPTVMVDGYASKEGTEPYNLNLSENRRQVVSAILKSKLIGPLEIGGKAHGESEPAVEETAKKGAELESQRALNRRVTIFIVSTPAVEVPKKPIDLSLPKVFKPETPEERFERILKEPPPTPLPKRSFSEMFWKKVDEGLDDILRKAKVPPQYRGLLKDGAHMLIEKGAEKALDASLDQTGLSDKEKEAIKAAIKALGETKF